MIALSISIAKANFKLRNEGSYLGILWYVLNPLALFAILLVIRGQAFAAADIPRYPLYLLIGLLMHAFFVQLLSAAIGVIQANGSFIKSVKAPLEALVISRAFQSAFSYLIEAALILALAAYLGAPLVGIFAYLGVFILFFIFTIGLAFLFATLGAYVSDLNNVWAVAGQLLFFITPIFHAPAQGSLLYQINLWNPLSYFIAAAREMFVYSHLPGWNLISILIAFSAVSLAAGYYVFDKKKARFAELV